MARHHPEVHHVQRASWLRAAVMGANDGIVSTASLLVGIAAAGPTHDTVVLAGIAGLAAGALSMAAGEYVSVSSQADIERADLAREAREQRDFPDYEHDELARIYRRRGLNEALADQVATALMAHDALGAHARDELGLSSTVRARPVLAAVTSATTFSLGATLPLMTALLTEVPRIPVTVAVTSLLFLALLGSLAAFAGGAGIVPGAARVMFWGALAMGLTAAIGALTGAVL